MVNKDPDLDVCVMCNNTRLWHKNNSVRHPFSMVNGELHPPPPGPKIVEGPGIVKMSTPFDPVLRMVLINKGIITTDDLDAAEKIIKHLTDGVNGG